MNIHTIVALSSGQLPSGVAIVRISGPNASDAIERLTDIQGLPVPRKTVLANIVDPDLGDILDRGLVIWFPAPGSFTGEDCVELHVHGSRAVVADLLSTLCDLPGYQPAEPGEFTRRAFDNGKFDLTQTEGLADLLAAETSAQRRLAMDTSSGMLRERAQKWRAELIRMRSYLEAEIDFVEEDDIPDKMAQRIKEPLINLINGLETALSGFHASETIRDGFRVALVGAPNAGKSSLLNALAKRDAAIVSDIPGTTRDVVEVRLDINGQLVVISDTAGIRDTDDPVEAEGVRRSKRVMEEADLIVELVPVGATSVMLEKDRGTSHVIVTSKDDAALSAELSISVVREGGLAQLEGLLLERLSSTMGSGHSLLLSRERHYRLVADVSACLKEALNLLDNDISLTGEAFRRASHSVGKLTGQIEVDELLGSIFSEFCVGK